MIYFKDLFKQSLTTVIEKVLNDAKYEHFFLVKYDPFLLLFGIISNISHIITILTQIRKIVNK